MEKIIYNKKLKKIVIATFIVMLLLNFIMPCSVNFVFAAELYEEMFYPDHPEAGKISSKHFGASISPEGLIEYYGEDTVNDKNGWNWTWNYEDYLKDENPSTTPYNTTTYPEFDAQALLYAVETYNDTLEESKDKSLVEALRTSIDAAVSARKQFR